MWILDTYVDGEGVRFLEYLIRVIFEAIVLGVALAAAIAYLVKNGYL